MSNTAHEELLRQAREREAREGGVRARSRFERSTDPASETGNQGKLEHDHLDDDYAQSTTKSVYFSAASASVSSGRTTTSEGVDHKSPTLPKSENSRLQPDHERSSGGGRSKRASSRRVPRNELGTSELSDLEAGNAAAKDARATLRAKVDMEAQRTDLSSDDGASTQSDEGSVTDTIKKPRSTSEKGRSSKSTTTASGTPFPDGAATSSTTQLHFSSPSIPASKKLRRARSEIPDDENSGFVSSSSSVETASSSGAEGSDTLSPPLLHQDHADSSFEEDDDDHIQAWKKRDYSAQKISLQLLKSTGLALHQQYRTQIEESPRALHSSSSSSKAPSNARAAGLSQSDIISSGSRSQSWANTTRPKPSPSARSFSFTRRQLVMLDGDVPPKGNVSVANAAKISHLTLDHLIQLIGNTHLCQDKNFLDTLILTHDYFFKSHDFLAVLILLYRMPPASANAETAHPHLSSKASAPALSLSPRSPSSPASPRKQTHQNQGTDDSSESKDSSVAKSPVFVIDESRGAPSSPRGGGDNAPTQHSINSSVPRVSLKAGDRSSSATEPELEHRSSSLSFTTSTSSESVTMRGDGDMDAALKRMRMINVLKKLIEMRFYILRKNRAFATLLQKFVQELSTSDDESENRFGEMLKVSMKTNAGLVREDDAEAPAPEPVLQEKLSSSNITSVRYRSASARKSLDDFNSVEIARQITLIDYANWKSIPMSEFAHAVFNAKDATTSCPRITACTRRFNELSQWVSSTVVLAAKKKHRVAVLTKFIQVMDELRNLKNFHALMAFYSALNQVAILRLKKTWKGVSSRVMTTWNNINKFLDNTADFKTYREFLKSADPPCIPYVGLILGGITFIEEFPTFIEEEDPKGFAETSPSPTGEKRRPISKRRLSKISSPSAASTSSTAASTSGGSPSRGQVRNYKTARRSSAHRTINEASDSAGADTENPESEPMRRAVHHDMDSAASSGADFSDMPPSPKRPTSRYVTNIITKPTYDFQDSDFLTDNSEDDDTKLRRVLNEPIPHTVVGATGADRATLRSNTGTAPSTSSSGSSHPTGTSSSPPVPGRERTPPPNHHPSSPNVSRTKRTRPHTRSGPLPPGQRLLNWRKMLMLAKSFADILRFQRTRYDLVVVKEIEKFVSDLRQHSWFLSPEELSSMSLEIEAEPTDSSSSGSMLASVKETLTSNSKSSPDGKRKDKKDKKDKSKARPTFAELLHDQILFSEFRKFLIAQYSHENLLFWEAVSKFKQVDLSQPESKIKAMANDIYGRFITGTLDDGDFTIGFSHDIKEAIDRKMGANDFEPSMFDSALQEVEHSLLKPSFGQFLNETHK